MLNAMITDAKINIKINGRTSFWSKNYEIYLNDNFVGNLNYKKSKIGMWSTVGTQNLLVKSKDFEKKLEVNLTTDKNILTVNIDENESINYGKFDFLRLSKKGIANGALVAFFILTLYLLFFTKTELKIAYIIPFLLLSGLAFSKKKEKSPFDLNVKNTY